MRLLHTMIRVKNLEESIRFYVEALGMKVLRRLGSDPDKTIVFVGYGEESQATVLELSYSEEGLRLIQPDLFGHIAIGVPDARAAYQRLVAAGATARREPREKDGEVIASIEDPNGYKIELIETG